MGEHSTASLLPQYSGCRIIDTIDQREDGISNNQDSAHPLLQLSTVQCSCDLPR